MVSCLVITMVPAFSGLLEQGVTDDNAETVSNGVLSQENIKDKHENGIQENIPMETADDGLKGFTSSVQSQMLGENTASKTSQVRAATSYQRIIHSPVRYGSSTISNYGVILRPELSNLSGLSGLSKLAAFINQNFNHRYGAATTAAGVERTGYGDCWGLSAWSAQILVKNGYDVRIVQGPSRESARHRWLEVLVDGKFVRFDPTMVTKKYGSKHYSTNIATKTSIVASYKGETKEETTSPTIKNDEDTQSVKVSTTVETYTNSLETNINESTNEKVKSSVEIHENALEEKNDATVDFGPLNESTDNTGEVNE